MTDTPETPPAKPAKSHGRLSIRESLTPRDLFAGEERIKQAWQAQIITLFPEAFPGVLGKSLTGRALQDGKWQLDTIDLRQFGLTKHRNVDDTPAGGGAGMVLRADVVGPALELAQRNAPEGAPLIYLSPRGRRFDQEMARRLSQAPGCVMLCGRFEGVDERVLEHFNVIEVSLGDFVLTGGEIAAQAMLDATVRLLPDVLGNADSNEEESFSNGLLEHPQYTKPPEWMGRPIPEVLLSGNHAAIEAWRKEQSEALTKSRRPDLWAAHQARTGEAEGKD